MLVGLSQGRGANLVIWPQKSGSYQTCSGLYTWQSAQPRYETNNGSNVLSLLWMQVKTFPCDTEQQPEFQDDWQSTHWPTLNFYYTTQHFNLQQLFFTVLFRGDIYFWVKCNGNKIICALNSITESTERLISHANPHGHWHKDLRHFYFTTSFSISVGT